MKPANMIVSLLFGRRSIRAERNTQPLIEMLIKRRSEIFEGLGRFESDRQALAECDIDLEELEISYRQGVIHLEGVVPSEHEHSILLQMLANVMGLTSMVDHIGTIESVEVISRLVPGRLAKPRQ